MSDKTPGHTTVPPAPATPALASRGNCAVVFIFCSLAAAIFAVLMVAAVSSGAITKILLGSPQVVFDDPYNDHMRSVRPIFACYEFEQHDGKSQPINDEARNRLYRTLLIGGPQLLAIPAQMPGPDTAMPPAAREQKPSEGWLASFVNDMFSGAPGYDPADYAGSAVGAGGAFDLDATPLQSWQRQIVDISFSLSIKRQEMSALAQQSLQARNQMQSWAIVIGALTTVLVGAKAIISSANCLSTFVGIAAVVTSAMGTALASFNGLYAPSDAWNSNRQAMTELRRTHGELVLLVTGIEDMCTPPNDAARAQLSDLGRRSLEVVAPRAGNANTPIQPSHQ